MRPARHRRPAKNSQGIFPISLPFNILNKKLPSSGISLVEILVVIVILSTVSVVGFTRLTATQHRQALTNATHQLQTALDTAHTRSVAQTPDSGGNPTSWGVLIDHLNPPLKITTGPFGPPQPSFDATPPPSGSEQASLPPSTNLTTQPVILNLNQILFISFEQLTGKPLVNKLNQTGHLVVGYTYNWATDFEIILQNNYGKQSVIINPEGITTVTKFQ